jgi:hypothetical protein
MTDKLPKEATPHLERAAGQNVVEGGHSPKQRKILERAGDAALRRGMWPHAGPHLALERDASGLRLVESR